MIRMVPLPIFLKFLSVSLNSSLVRCSRTLRAKILDGFIYGYFIMIIVFVIIFTILKSQQYSASTCFAVACWVNVVLSMFLRGMGLVDNYIFWASIILAALSAGMLYLSGNPD